MSNGYTLTLRDAAQALGISRQRVCVLVTAGKLDAKRFGRMWLVNQKSVELRLEKFPKIKFIPWQNLRAGVTCFSMQNLRMANLAFKFLNIWPLSLSVCITTTPAGVRWSHGKRGAVFLRQHGERPGFFVLYLWFLHRYGHNDKRARRNVHTAPMSPAPEMAVNGKRYALHM